MNASEIHQRRFCCTSGHLYDLLQLLDPAGISIGKRKRLRKRQYVSKGPNYVWHNDSYDNLKPCGIAIDGCIDGFSRNFTWLEAKTTKSDPRVWFQTGRSFR